MDQKNTPQKTLTLDECVQEFVASMTPADRCAYEIAKRQLESSFDIEKCIGLQDFIQENNIIVKK